VPVGSFVELRLGRDRSIGGVGTRPRRTPSWPPWAGCGRVTGRLGEGSLLRRSSGLDVWDLVQLVRSRSAGSGSGPSRMNSEDCQGGAGWRGIGADLDH